jgi:hypothetical protein
VFGENHLSQNWHHVLYTCEEKSALSRFE